MGTTQKPLQLVVHPELYHNNLDVWAGLVAQGHQIEVGILPEPRHYLGPNCWRMLDLEYLDITIAAIRKEVYAKGSNTGPSGDDPERPAVPRKRKILKSKRASNGSPNTSGTTGE